MERWKRSLHILRRSMHEATNATTALWRFPSQRHVDASVGGNPAR